MLSKCFCAKLQTSFITEPGSVMNVHVPPGEVTKHEIFITWWGVEGNCKTVDATLTRLHKVNDIPSPSDAVVVKELHFVESPNASYEHRFTDLEEGTVYGIRLRASGKAGTGEDFILTQVTKYDEPKKEDPILSDPTPESFLVNQEQNQPAVETASESDKPENTDPANKEKEEDLALEKSADLPPEPEKVALLESANEDKHEEKVETNLQELVENTPSSKIAVDDDKHKIEEKCHSVLDSDPTEDAKTNDTEPQQPLKSPQEAVADLEDHEANVHQQVTPQQTEKNEAQIELEPSSQLTTAEEKISPAQPAADEGNSPPKPTLDKVTDDSNVSLETAKKSPPQHIRPVLVIDSPNVSIISSKDSPQHASGLHNGPSVRFVDEQKSSQKVTPKDKSTSGMTLLEHLTSS